MASLYINYMKFRYRIWCRAINNLMN